MSSSNERWIVWALICVALALVSYVYRGKAQAQTDILAQERSVHLNLWDAMIVNKASAFRHLGMPLQWHEMDIVGGRRPGNPNASRYAVVLSLIENSCGACEETELASLKGLPKDADVRVVVTAAQRRFAAGVARINDPNGTVYFDEGRRFVDANAIRGSPLFILLDKASGTIVAADYPLPGRPEWTDIIHRMAKRLLGAQVHARE